MTRTYDVVVIGASPAGENIAQYATEGTGLPAAGARAPAWLRLLVPDLATGGYGIPLIGRSPDVIVVHDPPPT